MRGTSGQSLSKIGSYFAAQVYSIKGFKSLMMGMSAVVVRHIAKRFDFRRANMLLRNNISSKSCGFEDANRWKNCDYRILDMWSNILLKLRKRCCDSSFCNLKYDCVYKKVIYQHTTERFSMNHFSLRIFFCPNFSAHKRTSWSWTAENSFYIPVNTQAVGRAATSW
jgi:hypothetical protein